MPDTLPIESLHRNRDFRALRDIAGIAVDLRYATPMNFVGEDMYSPYDCGWLHRDAAEALQRAADALAARRDDLRLLIHTGRASPATRPGAHVGRARDRERIRASYLRIL